MFCVVRADASMYIGGGHILRCLALTNGLATIGWRSAFAVRFGTLSAVPFLEKHDHEIVKIDCHPREEAVLLKRRFPQGCDLLIIDHYQLDAAFEISCRKWARSILVIDDLTDRPHNCDILVNPAISLTGEDYRELVPRGCKILLGPDYALLRPEFSRFRMDSLTRRPETLSVDRIFVSFGFQDGKNMCSRTLEAVGMIDPDFSVDVVIGSGAVYLDEIERIADRSPFRVIIHKNAENVAGLMIEADLAVGAAGISSWERCCMGLPSIVIVTAENQLSNANALQKKGAAMVLGRYDRTEPKRIAGALRTLTSDNRLLKKMSERAARMCDGAGVQRVVEAVK